jgi:hypothetical protein
MKIKDLTVAAQKFSTNAAAGSNNYKSGVQNNSTWQSRTEAAKDTWAAGVSAAASNGRFQKGVTSAGQAKWQSAAVSKGQARFQSAVTSDQARQQWQSGFQPYAQIIAALPSPPRGVRGSPGNYSAVQQIGDALHKQKVSG